MSKLSREIDSVSAGGVNHLIEAYYTGRLHVAGKTLYPTSMPSVDVHRNYLTNVTDIITVTLTFPLGDFLKFIKPNKDNLEITLINYTVGNKNIEKYKFIITETNSELESPVHDKTSIGELNEKNVITFKGKALNISSTKLKLDNDQVEFKDTTVAGVINSVLGGMLGSFIPINGLMSRGLVMVTPNNYKKYPYIAIPNGVTALNIPTHLQEKYGVYNGGIGTYVQRINNEEKTYIYPLYANGGYSYDKKLTILDAGGGPQEQSECTYGVTNDSIKIIANKFRQQKPQDETSIRKSGTSIKGIDANSVNSRSVEVDDEKVTVKAEHYVREMKSRVLKSGEGGTKYVGVTSNFYKHRSDVLATDGTHISYKWINSNSELLRPGMPVVICTTKDDRIYKELGTLHGVTKLTNNVTKVESSILLIFVNNKVE